MDLLRAERPQAALVEIALEQTEDLPLIRSIRSECPDVLAVVFSRLPESAYAERALRAGALGFVSKKAGQGEILRALRAVSSGQAYFSDRTTTSLMTEMVRNRHYRALRELTGREMQVFEMLGAGRSVASIADELGLSHRTVDIYRRRILEKLALNSVDELQRRLP